MSGTDLLTALNKNGSGLNLRDLATSLVTAEVAPRRLTEERRLSAAEVSFSALGQLRGQFAQVDTAIAAIRQTPALTATSSSSAIAAAITDRSRLAEGETAVSVQSLASRHVLEFKGYTAADAVVGSGSLTVEFGVWSDPADAGSFAANPALSSVTLNVAEGTTLLELAEMLDGLDGVSARVLDKGDGTFSLGLAGEEGAGRGLRLTAVEGAVAGLAGLDTTTTNPARTVQSAADAMLTVDGITVFRPSNVIEDLVPGVRLALQGTTTGATLTVGRDDDTTRDNLAFLVETLNTTLATIDRLGARGVNGAVKGDLAGDLAVQQLRERLTALVTAPLAGHGAQAVTLADLGVATQRDGTLRLDKDAFDAAFAADPAAFDALFLDSLRSSDPRVVPGGLPVGGLQSGDYTFTRDAGTGEGRLGSTSLFTLGPSGAAQSYIALGGEFLGLTVTSTTDVTEATISYGRSFLSLLSDLSAEAQGASGVISRREAALSATISDAGDRLKALESRASALETRYLVRFAAMETAITQLKGTGTYLTNLVAAWNRKD